MRLCISKKVVEKTDEEKMGETCFSVGGGGKLSWIIYLKMTLQISNYKHDLEKYVIFCESTSNVFSMFSISKQ